MKENMVTGNPAKSLVFFAIPMVLGNVFQQLYNIIDSIIVGNFVGEEALAAVGASTSIVMLFVMIAVGTGIGCSVVISQLLGAKLIGKMKTAISTTLITVLGFSILLSIVGLVINKSILRFMGTPDNIFSDAATYLAIYFMGFVFLFMYNATSAIFNALGESKMPLFFLMFSSILNVVLDLVFVVNFKMGVAGVAWATLIAQFTSCILSLFFLIKRLKRLEPEEAYSYYDVSLLNTMLKVAIPTIVQQSVVSIGMLLVQVVVNRFGSSFMAGYTAASKVDAVVIVPIVAVGNAISTFTAQNIGAKKPERIKSGYLTGLSMIVVIYLVTVTIIHFFGSNIIGAFMNAGTSANAIEIGTQYLTFVSKFYVVMGFMNVTGGILRGSGDIGMFLFGSVMNLLARVSIAYGLAGIIGGQIIWGSTPIGWAIAGIIFIIRYKTGGWRNKSLIKEVETT